MTTIQVAAAAALIGSVAAGHGWVIAQADPPSAVPWSHASSRLPPIDPMPASCASGQSTAGEIEPLPPRSAEEVSEQGWARTPIEAAERTMAAPAFGALQHLTLRNDTPSRGTGEPARTTYRFLATDTHGDVRGLLIVSDVGFGAYATTFTEFCA